MSANLRAGIGGAGWIVYAFLTVPALGHGAWAYALLLLAALVLVPLALELTDEADEPARVRQIGHWLHAAQLPAALLLALACLLQPGPGAALAALPWVGFTLLVAICGWLRAKSLGFRRALGRLCGDVGQMFLGIGGLWLLADRAGVHPLGFDPAIVALTAVHFHFAGLLLPLLAGRLLDWMPFSRFASRAAVGVVLGVPAVALGITTTQLGWNPAIEAAAGWGLALSGMALGVLHIRLALELQGNGVTRALLAVAGVALFFGMVLAGVYASRAEWHALPWLDLAWMRAIHGTLNAFGFGLGGLIAWRRIEANRAAMAQE